MSHHHHEDHHEHDHHNNDHEHDHHHKHHAPLSFKEKMLKLTDHWLSHNSDHASSYREWAEKAKTNNMPELGSLLEEAADMTLEINKKFEKAAGLVKIH